MNIEQFHLLLAEIQENHPWPLKGKCIKYVRPHYDTRTRTFFGVTFDTLSGTKEFFIVNENRHRDLCQWITEWLRGKEQ